jgi:type II secretory pathway pseudopilin PulG
MRSSIVSLLAFAFFAVPFWVAEAVAQDKKGTPLDKTQAAPTEQTANGKLRPKVTISKETTYITEPLRPDGYPDYVRYFNDRLSQGVTPQNNATVVLLRALGPRELPADNADEYYRRLGMEPLPSKGDYYVDWITFSQQFSAKDWPAVPRGDSRNAKEYFESLDDEGRRRPWTKADYPLLARWLAANDKHIDQLVAASRRPRMYTPLLSEADATLVMTLLPVAQVSREAARALTARAMHRAGNGDIGGALDDLMACRRLASLAGQGFTLVESLVAIAIDHVGLDALAALLEHQMLTADHRRKIRDELAKLSPLRDLADTLDQGERFMYLDSVCWMSRDLAGSMEALQGMNESKGFIGGLLETAAKSAIDWDLILKAGNAWYDRLVEVARIDDRKEQLRALTEFDDDVKRIGASAKSGRLLLRGLIAPRETVSRQMADVLLALLSPAIEASINAERRNQANRALFDLGLALADHRDQHGSFPAKLEALAPKLIAKIPLDPMSGDPFLYRPANGGYLLYSVGHNGKDDGGQTADSNDGSDDLVITVPTKRPAE